MLKLVDRSRLGRGDLIHISSSLITHIYSIDLKIINIVIIFNYYLNIL